MFYQRVGVCFDVSSVRPTNLTTYRVSPFFSAEGPAQREMVSLAGGDAPKNPGLGGSLNHHVG